MNSLLFSSSRKFSLWLPCIFVVSNFFLFLNAWCRPTGNYGVYGGGHYSLLKAKSSDSPLQAQFVSTFQPSAGLDFAYGHSNAAFYTRAEYRQYEFTYNPAPGSVKASGLSGQQIEGDFGLRLQSKARNPFVFRIGAAYYEALYPSFEKSILSLKTQGLPGGVLTLESPVLGTRGNSVHSGLGVKLNARAYLGTKTEGPQNIQSYGGQLVYKFFVNKKFHADVGVGYTYEMMKTDTFSQTKSDGEVTLALSYTPKLSQ